MEILIFIGFVWFILALIKSEKNSSQNRTNQNSTTRTSTSQNTTTPPQNSRPSNPNTYKPQQARHASSPTIKFENNSSKKQVGGASNINQKEISDLRDAFSGEPLKIEKGLYRCIKCSVFYHKSSFAILQAENGSACVACGSLQLTAVSEFSASRSTGRNFNPSTISLEEIHQHIGRVITFEGYIHKVYESRRGTDYAAMFENASWTKGFKLVFFAGAVNKCGGEKFIKSLSGKNVRVRGLVVNHPRFGIEILISQRSMILSIT